MESEETAVCRTALETVSLCPALQERLLCSGILIITEAIIIRTMYRKLYNNSESVIFYLLMKNNALSCFFFYFRSFFQQCLCALPLSSA